jgi:type III pantothenate kinase
MFLAIDLGNTALSFALFEKGNRKAFFIVLVDREQSVDEYELTLKTLFEKHQVNIIDEGILLSSVVPSLNPVIMLAVERILKRKVTLFSKGFKTGVPIKIDHPSELGSDLVADSVGAITKYGYPLIIADLGTATKMIGIDNQGSFIGVSIIPGLKISLQALVGRAAQLMDVSLEKPKKILGKNTPDSMNSGVIYGTAAMIKSLFIDVEKEMGVPCKKVLTGGYSHLIQSLLPQEVIYDPYINVDGLYAIYLKNKELFQ